MGVTVEDLGRAITVSLHSLETVAGEPAWDAPAGDLEWTCRRTLDHVADKLVLCAVHLARRADAELPPLRDGDPDAGVPDLFEAVDSAGTLLACVALASDPDTRAFHPTGMADVSGFLAMACDEILVHTDDIARGLGHSFDPPRELCRSVVARLFPWAPSGVDPWAALTWANGRVALPDVARLDADWYWHCAPLSEWDGTIRTRSRAPRW